MKRLFTVLLTTILLSICAFAVPDAVEVDLGELYPDAELMATYGDLSYKVSNDQVTITDCRDYVTEVTIPEEIDGMQVTSIGTYAFYNCTSLESIEIPDSVTSIDDYAFSYCTSLESIEIPESVISIGEHVFYKCANLFFIYITDLKAWCEIDFNSTPLGDGVKLFLNGKAVKGNIVIPDGTTKIGNHSFYYCKDITSVTIPDSVTSIGNHAFEGCTSLESVEIGDGVTSIGKYAFRDCTSLESVEIGDSVTSLGYDAFYNCTSLEGVKIGDGLTSIRGSTFSCCTSLESIEIPDSVTSIGSHAFYDCTSLESVEIGNGVESIGEFAFQYCTSLESVEIGNSVTSIGNYAFKNCTNLKSVYITDLDAWCNIDFKDSYSNPFWYADNFYLNGVNLTELRLPETVSTVKVYVFYNCDWIEKLYIPKSVTKILRDAFYGCDNVKEIYYEGTADDWDKVAIGSNNNIFDTATMYFDYIPESYKIFFNANTSDSVENLPETKFALGTFTFPEENPKRMGYRFLGWSDEKDGEVKFTLGQKTEIYEEKTFYAVWEKKITIFDNPIKLEAAPFFSADGKTATVVVNVLDSVGFGGLCFDVEYDESILTLTGVTPAFASQYCTYDADTDGVITFEIENDENIIGNGALALLSFEVAEDLDSVFTEIKIVPDKENCFGYDEDDDYNPAPLAVEAVNGKIKPKGDFTGDGVVDMNDAILLLQHSMFPDLYPIE